jgi:four helix bundle protein
MSSTEINSYKDLTAWSVAMGATLATYEVVQRLPGSERFELSPQIRKAAVSIPSNIAEGHASGQTRRFLWHLGVARGSLAELETQLEVARRLGMLSDSDLLVLGDLLPRCGQLLNSLIRSLRLKLLKRTGSGLALIVLPCLCYLGLTWLG